MAELFHGNGMNGVEFNEFYGCTLQNILKRKKKILNAFKNYQKKNTFSKEQLKNCLNWVKGGFNMCTIRRCLV